MTDHDNRVIEVTNAIAAEAESNHQWQIRDLAERFLVASLGAKDRPLNAVGRVYDVHDAIADARAIVKASEEPLP